MTNRRIENVCLSLDPFFLERTADLRSRRFFPSSIHISISQPEKQVYLSYQEGDFRLDSQMTSLGAALYTPVCRASATAL